MRTTMNAVETTTTDFVLLNYSGTVKEAAVTKVDPDLRINVFCQEAGKNRTLTLGSLGSIPLGELFSADGGLSEDSEKTVNLTLLTAPLSVMAIGDEDEDLVLEDQDDDTDEEPSAESVQAAALVMSSVLSIIRSLHAMHFDVTDDYDFDEPTKVKHSLHTFEIKDENDEALSYFGLLARRNSETMETFMTLILTEPLPLFIRNDGKLVLASDGTKYPSIGSDYGKIILEIVSNLLPGDAVAAMKLNNVLLGFTDIDTPENVIGEVHAYMGESNVVGSDYDVKNGMALLTALEVEGPDDAVYKVATCVLPIPETLDIKTLDDLDFDGVLYFQEAMEIVEMASQSEGPTIN